MEGDLPRLQMRRRCFTMWSNLFLLREHQEIHDIWELHNGAVFIKLLQNLSQRPVLVSTRFREPRNRTQNIQMWMEIYRFLEDEKVNIGKLGLGDLADGDVISLLELLWALIHHYQILLKCKHSIMEEKSSTKRDELLQWVQSKIPQRNITNFSSDWNDGKAICSLVNSLKKDAIPERLFKDSSNAERNASIGIQMASELLGIPKILSSNDIGNHEIDELTMMAYLSMFYNLENFGKPNNRLIQKSHTEENVAQPKKSKDLSTLCKVYGDGLSKAQINQVAEFMLELNGANPADLLISVECKPFTGNPGGYRPELSVKPVDSNQFLIKYSPKRTGLYTIGVLHHGDHLWGSPFTVSVGGTNGLNSERLSGGSWTSQGSSSLSDNDSGFESVIKHECCPSSGDITSNRINKAEGPGLRCGEVGRLGVFNVVTETNNKGPLSVCITCPAVSIPVPYVKSRKHGGTTIHTVKYTPTEPGNYEIYVKWGDMLIQDSPFRVTISEADNDEDQVNQEGVDTGGKGKIRLYYSRTTLDRNEQKKKEILEKLLLEKGLTRKKCYDPPIAIDLVTDLKQRNNIFKKAETRNTPFLFVDGAFIGEYEKILLLNEKGLLDRILNFQGVNL